VGRYVARRLLQLVPVLIGATFLIYVMVFAIPGDPIKALFGERSVSPGTFEVLRERYNLNDPLFVQYGKYLAGVLHGDFGESLNQQRPVLQIVAERFPVTLKLALFAFAFETVLGLTAGLLAGLRRGSFMDNLVLISTTAVVSVPVFVLGYVCQLLLGVKFRLLPVAGLSQGWLSYVLPGMVLGALSLAYVARLTRTSLVENLRADYVRTATAKGLTRQRVVGRHALRNSLVPVVTFLGANLGELMAGAIITEGVFNIPGVGLQVFQAVSTKDGTVVVGIVTLLVLIFIVSNLVVDILYAALDPRIRYG
jgi:oligopeptide transport system permease protein